MKKFAVVLSLLFLSGFISAHAQDENATMPIMEENGTPEMNMEDAGMPAMDEESSFDMDDNAAEPDEEALPSDEMVSENEQVSEDAPAPAEEAPVPSAPAAAEGQAKKPVSYGDYRSVTLVGKAWEALESKDIESVLAYTNKCVELYATKAKEQQAALTDYVTGKNEDVFKQWALNDIATAYYIQGEAYRQANMKDEAKEAYNKIIKDFSFGQTWDPKGWFWKPAEAAKEKLAALESGVAVDYGDYSSSQLVSKAWAALANKDLDTVNALVNKVLELYSNKAKEMQASLKEYPWESKEKTFSYWALNDVGTALFIQGEAYRNAGQADEARASYQKLIDEYFYAQCWDPNGWFWKPAEAAQQKLGELDNA